jgi:clathrin heavy chain
MGKRTNSTESLTRQQGHQIINYTTSDDGQWAALVGITPLPGAAPAVSGHIQLFSRARNVSQALEGHAATFGTLRLEGAPADSKLFAFAVKQASGEAKLNIVEIDHNPSNPVFPKRLINVHWPQEGAADFPLGLHIAKKYGLVFVITKFGFIHLHDLETGTPLFMNRISDDTVFTSTVAADGTGIVVINRKGQVLRTTVNENTLVPYVLDNPASADIAYKLASKGGLPGADKLYQARFENLMQSGEYVEAAKVAANSPRGFLRTPQTMHRLRQAPNQAGQITVLLQCK